MSFYHPAPCPICGIDLDSSRHVTHGLMPAEDAELKRLKRLYVADRLGISGLMSPSDVERLEVLERKAGERP